MHHFVHPLVHFDMIVFCLLRYKADEATQILSACNQDCCHLKNAREETEGNKVRDVVAGSEEDLVCAVVC